MSIRRIAQDLYRLEQEVSRLEDRLRQTRGSERKDTEDLLRKARAERNRLRHILEGAKDDPPCRQPR